MHAHTHIAACRSSELSVGGYCKQHGISKSCYYYWLKRLNTQNKAKGFIALNIVESSSSSIELTYPNGMQLC
ncbi:MAG: hypothetical protein LBE82_04310 [Chitinophagaceae bacterium]|nr:hypothetical protein [Chitinophagaceae bacterium]